MSNWWEADLEMVFGDAFNDGPLVFQGSSTGCVVKQHDVEVGGVGMRDLSDRLVMCHYATAALLIPPTIGSTVTVAGTSYFVRHKDDRDAGITCLYLAQTP